MPRRATPHNPERMLRGPRGQDMVTRADAPDTEEQVRGGGPEVEGKIRALERRESRKREKRRAEESVERARLRAHNYQRNRGAGKNADQWVDELKEIKRLAQEEEGRKHAAWAAEEYGIDAQEEVHDQVAALYSACHPRLPGMDDTRTMH